MKEFVTPKQVARAIGVSESSLKRWCDKGLLPMAKTIGGHRRLPIGTVLEFIRTQNHRLVEPEQLGLPASTGSGQLTLDRAVDRLTEVLEIGDEVLVRQVIFDLHLANFSIAEIGDKIIRSAFQRIGESWECGGLEVFQERRACQTSLHALHELRSHLPIWAQSAPTAIGATLSGDDYQLPILLVEMVLRQSGWRAQSLGNNLTTETLITAIETLKPRIFWLSVSHARDEKSVIDSCERLNEVCKKHHVAFLIGGRWIRPDLHSALRYTVHCHTLSDVENFAWQVFDKNAVPAASNSETANTAVVREVLS